MENPNLTWMIWGYPHDLGNLHMINSSFWEPLLRITEPWGWTLSNSSRSHSGQLQGHACLARVQRGLWEQVPWCSTCEKGLDCRFWWGHTRNRAFARMGILTVKICIHKGFHIVSHGENHVSSRAGAKTLQSRWCHNLCGMKCLCQVP
jgi:hypothetical protein